MYQKIVGCARKWQEHWSSPWQYIWPLVVAVQSQEAKSVAKDRTCAQQRKWGEETDCVNARREHLDAKRQRESMSSPRPPARQRKVQWGYSGRPEMAIVVSARELRSATQRRRGAVRSCGGTRTSRAAPRAHDTSSHVARLQPWNLEMDPQVVRDDGHGRPAAYHHVHLFKISHPTFFLRGNSRANAQCKQQISSTLERIRVCHSSLTI